MEAPLPLGVTLALLGALLLASGITVRADDAPELPPDRYGNLGSEFEEGINQARSPGAEFDASLLTAVHYSKSEKDSGATRTEQAWINELGQLLKVSVEQTGPSGSDRTEFCYKSDRLFLVQTHSLTAPGTGSSGLLREIFTYRKDGVHVFTASVLDPSPKAGPSAQPPTLAEAETQAFKVVEKLMSAGPPEFDPTSGPAGGKNRLIMDSVSPDGHYALAFGLAQEKIPWSDYYDARRGGYLIPTNTPDSNALLRNYVVDLKTQKILGETGCQYSRTRSRDNDDPSADDSAHYRYACDTHWSSDSHSFVQIVHDRGGPNGDACRLGRIVGDHLLPTIDLQGPAEYLARKTAAPKGRKLDGKDRFEIVLDGYNKTVNISNDEITLELDSGPESNLVLEHFKWQVSHDVPSLLPHPTAEITEPRMGATPFFAAPDLDSEQAAQVEAIRRLLLEKQRQIELRILSNTKP